MSLAESAGSVFATRESLLEARRRSRGGGEVKAERPQGGTGRDTEWSRGGKTRGPQDNNNTRERKNGNNNPYIELSGAFL